MRKKPISPEKAKAETTNFMEKKLCGHKKAVRRQLKQCCHVIGVINIQFGVGIHQLKYSHLFWFLMHHDSTKAPKTRNNHWYIVLRLIEALGKEEIWKPGLSKGPWIRPTGDQRTSVAVRRPSKKATPAKRIDREVKKPVRAKTKKKRK